MHPDEIRLQNKLALWEVPGFSQFIADLARQIDIVDVQTQVDALKNTYKRRLEEMQPKSKFSQPKLPFNGTIN